MDLSVVVPIYNEEGNLPLLYSRLNKVLENMDTSYEVIFVNDGSEDGSLDIIRDISRKDKHIQYLNFSRNFGHQIAFYAGMVYSEGKSVVTMDGDLQDPPELIPELLEKMENGKMVVYAKRRSRKGISPFKRFAYKAFYRILSRITSIDIPLDTGDFRIADRKVIEMLKKMPEQEKFLRGQIAWIGFDQDFIEYDRDERHSGTPGYTWRKLFHLALDGITSFSNLPLKVATVMGFVVSFVSFAVLLRALYVRLFTQIELPWGWTSQMIAILLLGGIQLIAIGIIGEYISRMHSNIRNRPLFIIKSTSLKEE